MNKVLNILVTGGLGHIGSYLLRNFGVADFKSNLIVVDSLLTQRVYSLFDLPEDRNIGFFQENVRSLKKDFFLSQSIDLVLHLSAITDAASSVDKRDELFANNLESTLNLIEHC